MHQNVYKADILSSRETNLGCSPNPYVCQKTNKRAITALNRAVERRTGVSGTPFERYMDGGNMMTTETLNFPVFHSDQGIEADDVQFAASNNKTLTPVSEMPD